MSNESTHEENLIECLDVIRKMRAGIERIIDSCRYPSLEEELQDLLDEVDNPIQFRSRKRREYFNAYKKMIDMGQCPDGWGIRRFNIGTHKEFTTLIVPSEWRLEAEGEDFQTWSRSFSSS